MNELRQFLPYVRTQKKLYLLGFIGSLFRFLIPLSVPLVVKYLFDDLLRNEVLSRSDKIGQLLLIAAIMLGAFFLIRAPMEYVRQYFLNRANNRIITALRKDAFAKVHSLDSKYFADNRSGEIGTRFFDDIEKIRGYMTALFSNVWIELVVLVCVVGLMLTLNPELTLIAVLLVGFQFVLAHVLSRKVKSTTRTVMNYRSVLSGFVLERIQGALWSKLFQSEKRDRELLDGHLDQYSRMTDRQVGLQALSLSSVNVLSDFTPFLVVAIGSLFVIDGRLTLGCLIAFFAYVDRMRGPVAALVQAIPAIAEGSVALQRIFDFMAVPVTVREKDDAKTLMRFEDAIVFDRVSFAYNGRNRVIDDVSIRIERGKTYAFVGESGGGKSTILQLITRMYDVDHGEVLIDGTNIKAYSLESLRTQLGVVTQDNFLYSTSIIENIRMAKPDATDAEVVEAARKAFAHDFITFLPNGYETAVGERGVKLSGGQKQRIALARVFLKDPAIVLLDEATSALDNESEKLVQASIERMAHTKTIVMIAHRLSTVVHADRIFVLRKGRIIESGDHKALLQMNGYYRDLYEKQKQSEQRGAE
ncbi:ABC transporter ATP-binding protein [Paenibacillus soyae]|uniref:ABC transporter ATP-binding protein/permease n=1 Tax=Paenibacillus soyae TaxID=2969249 RepID=A0A9X2SCB0_9BACL|nr:ABC transporter ATP-binding protein [Paenibacillus soyae]MCR2805822.1 ABC transporter ATP-binding protein/permease [Paenibacillus soyae]